MKLMNLSYFVDLIRTSAVLFKTEWAFKHGMHPQEYRMEMQYSEWLKELNTDLEDGYSVLAHPPLKKDLKTVQISADEFERAVFNTAGAFNHWWGCCRRNEGPTAAPEGMSFNQWFHEFSKRLEHLGLIDRA